MTGTNDGAEASQRLVTCPALPRPNALTLRFVVASILASALLIGLTAQPAMAQPAVEVDVGVNGYYNPGEAVPVRVTVAADRLLDGHIDVIYPDDSGLRSSSRIPVSMTGGSVKSFVVAVPTTPWNQARVTVNLVEGNEIIATTEPRLTSAGGDDLVAVMPTLASRSNVPNTADVLGDLGTARLTTLDLDDLALGPNALDVLDIVVGLPTDLDALTATELAVVLGWVDEGGLLLVDTEPGTNLSWVPEAWQPDARGKAMAGRGEIRLTGGDATAGRWDDLFPPTRTRGQEEEQMLAELGGGIWFGSISESIARDVNIGSIGLGLVTGLLVGYAVLAGPVLFFILRRTGRHSLAWLLVPALALVGTGAAVVSRSNLRPDNTNGHATILASSPAGTRATSFVLVGSSGGGTTSVALDDGWQVSNSRNEGGGPTDQVALPGRIDIDLPPGGYGIVGASGQTLDRGLGVESRSTGIDEVEVTVTNLSDVVIDEIAVVVASTGTAVGSLDPGSSTTVVVDDIGRLRPGQPPDANWWPELNNRWFEPRNIDPDDDQSKVSGGLWTEVNQGDGTNFRPIGSVLAIGWRDDRPSPLGEGEYEVGTTMLMSVATVQPGGDHLLGVDVPRTLVRGPFDVGPLVEQNDLGDIGPRFLEAEGRGVYRFELPADVNGRPVDDARLVAQLADATIADVWVDDDWVPLRTNFDQPTVVALPEGSSVDGTVLVRFALSLERVFNGGAHTELLIRESAADEDVADPPPPAALDQETDQ